MLINQNTLSLFLPEKVASKKHPVALWDKFKFPIPRVHGKQINFADLPEDTLLHRKLKFHEYVRAAIDSRSSG